MPKYLQVNYIHYHLWRVEGTVAEMTEASNEEVYPTWNCLLNNNITNKSPYFWEPCAPGWDVGANKHEWKTTSFLKISFVGLNSKPSLRLFLVISNMWVNIKLVIVILTFNTCFILHASSFRGPSPQLYSSQHTETKLPMYFWRIRSWRFGVIGVHLGDTCILNSYGTTQSWVSTVDPK